MSDVSLTDADGTVRFQGSITGLAAAGVLATDRIPVTSAQVLACFTTPVELIPAPGAGSGIVVLSATVETVGATVPYDAAQPVIKSEAGTWADLSGQLSTDSDLIYVYAASAVSGGTAEFFEDVPVVLTDTTRDPLDGTAALSITLVYYLFDLA